MRILSFLKSLRSTLFPKASNFMVPKSWEKAQEYEIFHAIEFMKKPDFLALMGKYKEGKLDSQKGYIDTSLVKDFFEGDSQKWRLFQNHLENKSCLDIGPCVFSPLSIWNEVKQRWVIEPLLPQIKSWQKENLGFSPFDNVTGYSSSAETLVPELVNQVDGAIYCRNMLDHTPKWPFVMANISLYARKNCKLLFWSDLDHFEGHDEGHYDICTTVEEFRNLTKALGFAIEHEFQYGERKTLNWGCLATKL